MRTTNTGQIKNIFPLKQLLGGGWGHVKVASTFCSRKKEVSDSSSSLRAFLYPILLWMIKVGKNRHLPVHLDAGDGPKSYIDVKLASPEARASHHSNTYMNHQGIL